MSTSEVFQLCLVIIGICSLFVQAYKKKRPPSPRKVRRSLQITYGGLTAYRQRLFYIHTAIFGLGCQARQPRLFIFIAFLKKVKEALDFDG